MNRAALVENFDRDGFIVVPDAYPNGLRQACLAAARRLLASNSTQGRDRGADNKDGFRGCLDLDPRFLPLITNPIVLDLVVELLSPNIHLLSTQLIALPSIPLTAVRSIRTPERPGWHRDLYGVSDDLGWFHTPRLSVKVAHYLSDLREDSGTTMFLPGSHLLAEPPVIPPGEINPPDALTPAVGTTDVVVFENRTWHAGGLNSSGAARIALMLQYGYRWLAPVDAPSAHLIWRDDLTPLERQLLGGTAGDHRPDGSYQRGYGALALQQQYSTSANDRRRGS